MSIDIRIEKVPIYLDKKRNLVCNLYALCEIDAEYGDFKNAVTQLGRLDEGALRKILCLFLWHEDEGLTEESTGELIQGVDKYYLQGRIFQAIQKSLPTDSENNSNHSQVVASGGEEWNLLYYMGTVLLGMSEAAFWRCTMRKFLALWKIYETRQGLKKQGESQPEEVFIDQLGW